MISIKVTANGTVEAHSDSGNWGIYSDSRTCDRMAITTCYYKSNVVSIGYRYLYVTVGRFKATYSS